MDIAHLQRCGEIFRNSHKEFSLNCLLCPTTCVQLFSCLQLFVAHIEQDHKDEDEKPHIMEKIEISMVMPLPKFEETSQDDPLLEVKNEYVEFDSEEYSNHEVEELGGELPADDDALKEQSAEQVAADKYECQDGKIEELSTANDNDQPEQMYNVSDYSVSSLKDSADVWNSSTRSAVPVTKDILNAIIEAYGKQPVLWKFPHLRMIKKCPPRDAALTKIAAQVNAKCGCNLTAHNVGQQITKVRSIYRKDLAKEKKAKANGKTFEPSWYHDKLSFLNRNIEGKERIPLPTPEKKHLHLPNLTHEKMIHLIDLYKGFPCLWDTQHIGYRFKKQRLKAMYQLRQAVKHKLKVDYTQIELQRQLQRLRLAFSKEKLAKWQSQQSGDTDPELSVFDQHWHYLEDNVGPFKCPYCEVVSSTIDRHRIHKSQHDKSMPFTCPLCQQGFKNSGNCTVHLRRHTRDYNFQCEVCENRYATTTELNLHMRCHTGEKPYFCEICGKSFRTAALFKRHNGRHHNTERESPQHICPVCQKAFYHQDRMRVHMKTHSNKRDKVCPVCGKGFTTAKYLRQHKQIHAENKPYACRICGKDFAQYAGLSGHMKSHGTRLKFNSGNDFELFDILQ